MAMGQFLYCSLCLRCQVLVSALDLCGLQLEGFRCVPPATVDRIILGIKSLVPCTLVAQHYSMSSFSLIHCNNSTPCPQNIQPPATRANKPSPMLKGKGSTTTTTQKIIMDGLDFYGIAFMIDLHFLYCTKDVELTKKIRTNFFFF